MLVSTDYVDKLDINRFMNEIPSVLDFVDVKNIRKEGDLTNKTFLGRVVRCTYGLATLNGNEEKYCALFLCDLKAGQDASAKELLVYLYDDYADGARFNFGDYVAISNAVVNVIPVFSQEVVFPCSVICRTNSGDLKPILKLMTTRTPHLEKPPVNEPRKKNVPIGALRDIAKNPGRKYFGRILDIKCDRLEQGFLFKLLVTDPSLNESGRSPVELVVKFLNECDVPEFSVGDIVSFHHAFIKKGDSPSRVTVPGGRSCLFWSTEINATMEPKCSSRKVYVLKNDTIRLNELRHYYQQNFIQSNVSSLQLANVPLRLGSESISSLKRKQYFDLICQVVLVTRISKQLMLLRVWDGTVPSVPFKRHKSDKYNGSKLHDEVLDLTVDVKVSLQHQNVLIFQPEDIILFRNLRMTLNKHQWELELHPNTENGFKIWKALNLLNNSHSQKFKHKLDGIRSSRESSTNEIQDLPYPQNENKRLKTHHTTENPKGTESSGTTLLQEDSSFETFSFRFTGQVTATNRLTDQQVVPDSDEYRGTSQSPRYKKFVQSLAESQPNRNNDKPSSSGSARKKSQECSGRRSESATVEDNVNCLQEETKETHESNDANTSVSDDVVCVGAFNKTDFVTIVDLTD